MSKLVRAVVLVTVFMSALIVPPRAFANCVGERRACMQSALLEQNDCKGGCDSTWCFFGCEMLYDLDRIGCWGEYLGCINLL